MRPDLTIYLDIAPKLGLERIKQNRQDEVNRLDQEDLTFYEDVYQAYQELAKKEPERIVKIDATKSLPEVIAQVEQVLAQRIPAFLGKEVF